MMKVATLLLLVLPCITWAKVFFYNGQNHQHFQDRRNVRDNCLQFFKDGMPPTGFIDDNNILQENVNRENANQFAVEICQKYKGTYHFATLYNTKFRTPIYSAYIFPLGTNPQRGQKITENWKYEGGLLNSQPSICEADRTSIYAFVKPKCAMRPIPQILQADCTRQETEMLTLTEIRGISYCLPARVNERRDDECTRGQNNENDALIERYLQLTEDYGNIVQLENEDPFNFFALYDKGHLLPQRFAGYRYNTLQENMDDRQATYTMTNAAPQNLCLNRGAWNNAEKAVFKLMKDHCKDPKSQTPQSQYKAYFITGTGYNGITPQMTHNGKKIPFENVYDRSVRNIQRIAVPDFFWTAACCIPPQAKRTDGFGVAYLSDGNEDGSKVIPGTVHGLEEELTRQWEGTNHPRIRLFPNNDNENYIQNPCYKSNPATQQWTERMKAWANLFNAPGINTIPEILGQSNLNSGGYDIPSQSSGSGSRSSSRSRSRSRPSSSQSPMCNRPRFN